jgi:hypothetical protein
MVENQNFSNSSSENQQYRALRNLPCGLRAGTISLVLTSHEAVLLHLTVSQWSAI